ncbi:MAG: hypothetical protein ACPGRX_02615, partial [Bdellovibrionales bacterium]
YEGLTFSYQGTSSATVNVDFFQGLSDRLYNTIDGYANATDGLITDEKLALQETNDDLSSEAARIREIAENFRLQQIDKYAEFEAKLSSLNLLLDQIRAILGTNNDRNN